MHIRTTLQIAALFAAVGCATSTGDSERPAPAAPMKVLCPDLRWDAFPSDADLARDVQGALVRAERISYHLRVIDRDDGQLVFERRGLNEAHHKPLVWLDPRRRYLWTVRPVFWIDNQRRVGDWLGTSTPKTGVSNTGRCEFVPIPLEWLQRVELPQPDTR